MGRSSECDKVAINGVVPNGSVSSRSLVARGRHDYGFGHSPFLYRVYTSLNVYSTVEQDDQLSSLKHSTLYTQGC